MPPPRISADFNGIVTGPTLPGRTAVVLDTVGSIRDLANAGIILKEGMPLIAYDESDDEEDLEGHGLAQFDRRMGWWVVEFDELGVRYVPAADRTPDVRFRCVSCRVDVSDRMASLTDCLEKLCPLCHAPLNTPLRSPG